MNTPEGCGYEACDCRTYCKKIAFAPTPPEQPAVQPSRCGLTECQGKPMCEPCQKGLRGAQYGSQPAAQGELMDEQIDAASSATRDDLLDHIYEYGTAAEGVIERIRKIARAVIAADRAARKRPEAEVAEIMEAADKYAKYHRVAASTDGSIVSHQARTELERIVRVEKS